jgi:transcriptional regulator with XRE-family HTH domain
MGYRGQIEKQNRARDLRSQGWTLTEICEEVGCSRSSASAWCRDVELDEAVLNARRRDRFLRGNEGARLRGPNKLQLRKQAEIEELRREGISRIGILSDRELLVAGLAYYSGEGCKTAGGVKFANSDPRLIVFFLTWLRRFFDVDESRVRLRLYLHDGLDLAAANRYWSDLTGIPQSQFGKAYRAVPDPSIRKAKHIYGCPSICYSCTRTHRSIMGMIDALLSCGAVQPGGPSPEEIDPG